MRTLPAVTACTLYAAQTVYHRMNCYHWPCTLELGMEQSAECKTMHSKKLSGNFKIEI